MLSLLALGREHGRGRMAACLARRRRTRISIAGAGEPVVFVHAGVFADWFGPLMDEPALRRFQLVSYHRIGYAGSSRVTRSTSIAEQAAQLHLLLAQLGLRRVHLVGHSSGALIAMQLALDAPEAVQTLTLLEPALPVAGPSPGIAVRHFAVPRRKTRCLPSTHSCARWRALTTAPPSSASIHERSTRPLSTHPLSSSTSCRRCEPSVSARTMRSDCERRYLLVMGERSDEVSPIWRQRHELLLQLDTCGRIVRAPTRHAPAAVAKLTRHGRTPGGVFLKRPRSAVPVIRWRLSAAAA